MRHHFLPAVMALAFAASAAQAQQAGVYEGTTDDGSSVYIQVAQDPNTANFEVNAISFGLTMPCLRTGEILSDIGIGLLDGYDIVNGKFNYASSDFYGVDLVASMTFEGVDRVSGTVSGGLAAFNPAYGHTKFTRKVQACVSPKQGFTASFTGAPKKQIAPGTVQVRRQPQLLKR